MWNEILVDLLLNPRKVLKFYISDSRQQNNNNNRVGEDTFIPWLITAFRPLLLFFQEWKLCSIRPYMRKSIPCVKVSKRIIEYCNECSYFPFNNELYQQVEGMAMGNPASFVLANFVMNNPLSRHVSVSFWVAISSSSFEAISWWYNNDCTWRQSW